MNRVLVVSTEADIFNFIQSCLRSEYKVGKAGDKAQALEVLKKKRYDFLFIDIDLIQSSQGDEDPSLLQPFWHLYPTLEIIIMAPQEKIRDAVMAVKAGASNYVTYPLNAEEVRYVTETTYRSKLFQSEIDYLRDQFWQRDSTDMVRTTTPEMQAVFNKVRSVATTKSTVLLSGETGTGKSMLAKLIHQHSHRRNDQFISLHCGAIPDNLVESELFGHEKGAFTGAVRKKLGKFEIASGGTIFLDEIGTVTPSAQIKLLQVLHEGTFQRVGGEDTIKTDVRIIAATNSDLKSLCDNGLFRKDLYYRLNVFPIEIPPLRERMEDIPLFVDAFLKKLNMHYHKAIHGIQPEVLRAFQHYQWPGNIRELENLLERAYILEASSMLTLKSFPREILEPASVSTGWMADRLPTLAVARQKELEDIERRYIKEILERHRGRINEAAKTAGISTRQLHKLMTKYDIHKEPFKT
ncbi:MAG: sigma-54 dependent transcriptional regulator [Thermodesulfobacteriota bacterium]